MSDTIYGEYVCEQMDLYEMELIKASWDLIQDKDDFG